MGDRVDEEKLQGVLKDLLQNRQERARLGNNAQTLAGGDGLKGMSDLLSVVELKAWDTKLFKRKIARLHPLRLTEEIVKYTEKFCRREGVECLYYLADFTDPRSIELAEEFGFNLVDLRLKMVRDLLSPPGEDESGSGIRFRPATDNDRPALEKIAEESFRNSRFFFDRNFPREDCEKLYRVWIRKSLRGEYGTRDRVFVAEVDEQVTGFISCDVRHPSTGLIILVGVRSDFQGRSIGKKLLHYVLRWMADQGLTRVEVVTQGRNVPAQILYQRTGFHTIETRLWYHKWFS
jgi:dTDP-4-amino-4,6-dideoxy-D-galactose acyltransferase